MSLSSYRLSSCRRIRTVILESMSIVLAVLIWQLTASNYGLRPPTIEATDCFYLIFGQLFSFYPLFNCIPVSQLLHAVGIMFRRMATGIERSTSALDCMQVMLVLKFAQLQLPGYHEPSRSTIIARIRINRILRPAGSPFEPLRNFDITGDPASIRGYNTFLSASVAS